jgi:hypothetical protein
LSRHVTAVAFACAALASTTAGAAERTVTVPETVVRTAPAEVAPEMARAHAGETLSADEQAQGGWRRVQLPDGRYGFVHDADTKAAAESEVPVPADTAAATVAGQPAAVGAHPIVATQPAAAPPPLPLTRSGSPSASRRR